MNTHMESWLQAPMSQFVVHDYAGYLGWGRVLMLWSRHYYTGGLQINYVATLESKS